MTCLTSSLSHRTCRSATCGSQPAPASMRVHASPAACGMRQRRQRVFRLQAFQVEIQHEAGSTVLQVEEDQTILEAALDSGLELSHDCKMGVCMTCPAKLEAGRVDQSAGMLDDDVKEKGYALLCVSTPQSDCRIRTIEEDELLAQVLHGG